MKKSAPLPIAIAALILTLACFPDVSQRPDLEFDPLESPAAQVGLACEATITVSRNVIPVYRMVLNDGVPPDGRMLEYSKKDSCTKIVGTSPAVGRFKFKLRVSSLGTSVAGQTGEKEYVCGR